MASAVPKPGSPIKQQLRETRHPLAITCLQWDGDGALHEDDQDWMLQKLASQDRLSIVRVAWEQRNRV